MKQLIIIALLLPFFGNSQEPEECIQSRWIALKPNEINKDLFLPDSIDLVSVVKKLAEENKIGVNNRYRKNRDVEEAWYYIPYDLEVEENLRDSAISNKDTFFQISSYSDIPIYSEWGEPVYYLNEETGEYEEHFYPPEIYIFPSKECNEIRIKETRIFNDSTEEYEFIPVGLSFYFKGSNKDYWSIRDDNSWADRVPLNAVIPYNRGESDVREGEGYEKFWIDLDELFEALDDKTKYPWYEAIINKRYQGFQYMQTSCYDDEIKY